MRLNIARSALVFACALTLSSCGSGMPSSPSALGSSSAPAAAGGQSRMLDDPPAPMPDPAMPGPDAPAPMPVTIGIIGYYGASAFMPNPAAAGMGDQIVFTNNDARMHHIVFDDGTDLGEVQPGQSSAPTPLNTPSATYHCTIHPTMIGGINAEVAAPYEPPEPDPYYLY